LSWVNKKCGQTPNWFVLVAMTVRQGMRCNGASGLGDIGVAKSSDRPRVKLEIKERIS
jgi:hypothetical protein